MQHQNPPIIAKPIGFDKNLLINSSRPIPWLFILGKRFSDFTNYDRIRAPLPAQVESHWHSPLFSINQIVGLAYIVLASVSVHQIKAEGWTYNIL